MSNLRELRERSEKSQSEVASLIGVSQSQYSKYEADLSGIPFGTLLQICNIIGCTPDEITVDTTQEEVESDINPYESLEQKIKLLEGHLENAPQLCYERSDIKELCKAVKAYIEIHEELPVVGLLGRYDSGKSTTVNVLLGRKDLPEGYQPVTSCCVMARHKDFRPLHLEHDAYVLNKKFNLDNWQDEKEYENCIAYGDLSLVHTFGTHKNKASRKEEAFIILIFVDAPILRSCVLLDVPGTGNSTKDTEYAVMLMKRVHVFLYTSPCIGFVDAPDMPHLGMIIRCAPLDELNGATTLGNLFILATHASPNITPRHLEEIKKTGASRIFEELEEAIKERSSLIKKEITVEDIEKRIFPFWRENKEKRTNLVTAIKRVLFQEIPSIKETSFISSIVELKKKKDQKSAQKIEEYLIILSDLEKAEKEFEAQKREEPQRLLKRNKAHSNIMEYIPGAIAESKTEFKREYEAIMDVSEIEEIINRKYSNKDDAAEYAPKYINELINSKMMKTIENRSRVLSDLVAEYLKEYEKNTPTLVEANNRVVCDFDTKAAFIGGLSGLTSIGALGMYFASLGNLGGYIAVAKIASILSALGIPLSAGGTAGVVSLVAALGGPIIVITVIGAIIGFIAWLFSSESWQTKIAKKIIKEYDRGAVMSRYLSAIEKTFLDAEKAFLAGSEELEKKYLAYVDNLEKIIKSSSPEDMKKRIEEVREIRSFLLRMRV